MTPIDTPTHTSPQLCSVTLLGNLVAAPDIRYLANPAIAICEIALATTHKWQDKVSKQWKEWTSYHQVKVVGELAENALRFAQKGDLLLVQGYLADNKVHSKSNPTGEVIHATSLEHFAKGYTQSINQVTISGTISSNIQLMTSERNQVFCQFELSCHHQAYAEQKQSFIEHQVTRQIKVWGKPANNLTQYAKQGDKLVVEGRLSYSNDSQKHQYIDANKCHLLKPA